MEKVGRFTHEQLLLSDGLKKLIELYYLLKTDDGGKWDSESVANILTQFFKAVFGQCRYDYNSDTFCIYSGEYIEVGDQQLSFFKRNSSIPLEFDGKRMFVCNSQQFLKISENELRSFLDIMDSLYEVIKKRKFIHFSFGDISNYIDTSITKENKSPNDKNAPYSIFTGKANWADIRKQIDKTIVGAVKNQKNNTMVVNNIKIFSSISQLVQVNTHSEFAKKILYIEPKEEPPTTIPSLGFQSWDSFIRIIRSLLVYYHRAFGDYKRIKLCKFCKKLFFEKKKGSRVFCSNDCIKKHSDTSEPREKFKCRNRQNEWYRRSVSNVGTLQKNNCKYCKKYSKKIMSGYCPLVKQ